MFIFTNRAHFLQVEVIEEQEVEQKQQGATQVPGK